MEFRIEKTTLGLIVWLMAAPACMGFEYPARHDHWRKGCAGFLKIDADGVSFREISNKEKPEHNFAWSWADIQQLEIGDGRLVRVLSYKDRTLLAGKDQPYDFTLDDKPDLTPVYELLRGVLDQRFIVRLADMTGKPQWQLPVKRLGAVKGTEGVLAVFSDRVVYQSKTPMASRTWRDSDIDNISSDGPFQLTVVTPEHDGRFEFQLRQRLEREQYEALWLRLNRPKGLELISDKQEKTR